MSQQPFNIGPQNQNSQMSQETSEQNFQPPSHLEFEYMAPLAGRQASARSNSKSQLNRIAMAVVPVLVGAGIFVACTSHKDASVESTSSASVSGDSKSEIYPDENIDGFESVKNGKAKHAKGSHSAKSARHSSHDNVYVVQIGAFRVKQNAERLNEKLKTAGYPVELQQIEHSSNGQLFLVRMNPMTDRQQAEEMRTNLKAKIDIDSMILALPKTERAVSSTGASQTPTEKSVESKSNSQGETKSNSKVTHGSDRSSSKDGGREAANSDSRSTEIR